MIQWDQVAKELRDWIVAESGLADGAVIWSEKEGARPPGKYIAMRMSSVRAIGHEWMKYDDAEDPEPGEELTAIRQGFREAILTLQCFAAKNDAVITAVATLDKAMSAHRKYKGDLKAVGVAVLGVEQIQSINGMIGLSYEARAIGTVRLSLASNVVGVETYIENTALEGMTGETTIMDEIVGPGVLAPPTNLAAEAGDEQVTLTWETDGSAESFSLYFSLSSPVDVDTATEIVDVTSPYVHTGRVNGTEYFYAVTGHHELLGESALSNEVSATPTD